MFERTKRKVLITEIGIHAVEQARRILKEADRMGQLAQAKMATLTGRFRLGGIATVSPYLTPYYLMPLKKTYPHLDLKIYEGYTDELLKDLKNGNLDAVIASPTFDEDGFQLTHLYFEPFMLAYPIGHPIGNVKDILPTKLNAKEMILLGDGHCLSDQVLEACSKVQKKHDMDLQATSLITLLQVVAAGNGYTIVPQMAAIEDPRLRGLIKFKHFANQKAGRIVTLVTREEYTLKKDILAIKEIIQKHLPAGVTKV